MAPRGRYGASERGDANSLRLSVLPPLDEASAGSAGGGVVVVGGGGGGARSGGAGPLSAADASGDLRASGGGLSAAIAQQLKGVAQQLKSEHNGGYSPPTLPHELNIVGGGTILDALAKHAGRRSSRGSSLSGAGLQAGAHLPLDYWPGGAHGTAGGGTAGGTVGAILEAFAEGPEEGGDVYDDLLEGV